MATATGGRCAACGQEMSETYGRGRVRQYCDATCRSAARRRRGRAAVVNDTLTGDRGAGKTGGVPTTPLDAVVAARADLGVAESRLREEVDAARDAGSTWAEIGDVLGITRQAAFQRFGRPVDPRTGEPMNASILPGAADSAVALFVNIAEGNWAAVRETFDERVAQALPDEAAIASTWAGLVGQYGRYEQRMGEPFARQLGDYTVVDIPLQFETGEQVGRVSFDSTGKVAGIFVVPPGMA
jgi:Protein of unknown function (DUF3887)